MIFTKDIKEIVKNTTPIKVVTGGRSTGKTWLIANDIVTRCATVDDIAIVCVNKYYASVLDTMMPAIAQVIKDRGMEREFIISKAHITHRITKGIILVKRLQDFVDVNWGLHFISNPSVGPKGVVFDDADYLSPDELDWISSHLFSDPSVYTWFTLNSNIVDPSGAYKRLIEQTWKGEDDDFFVSTYTIWSRNLSYADNPFASSNHTESVRRDMLINNPERYIEFFGARGNND